MLVGHEKDKISKIDSFVKMFKILECKVKSKQIIFGISFIGLSFSTTLTKSSKK